MSITDPKHRMVSFRLSAIEYSQAQARCRTQGFRSLSAYARSAVLAVAFGDSAEHEEDKVKDLRLRVERLTAEVARLSRMISGGGTATDTCEAKVSVGW